MAHKLQCECAFEKEKSTQGSMWGQQNRYPISFQKKQKSLHSGSTKSIKQRLDSYFSVLFFFYLLIYRNEYINIRKRFTKKNE